MNSFGKMHGTAIVALAVLGVGGLAVATTSPDADPSSPVPLWHHHSADDHERGSTRGMLHVLGQLNLNEAQKQQVRAITSNARAQWRSQAGLNSADLVALGNPGDPKHAGAVAAAQARASQRIQNWSEVQQQIYAVLTPAQQAQLPQLLTEMGSRHMGRHAAAAGTTTGS